MVQNSQFEELINKGTELLGGGDYFEAIETLEKALLIKDTTMVRNQLALAYYYDSQPVKAMEVLRSTLAVNENQPFYHPFSFSLAAIILAVLGKAEEAGRFLDLAIEGYREGSSLLQEAGLPFDSVGAYLAMIMKAAGELNQHHRLLEMFQSWKKDFLSWECVYYAAAAAFNLHSYHLAADYWALIGRAIPICRQMQKLALMVEQAAIPPFEMEYRVISSAELQEQLVMAFGDPSYQEEFINKGYARMLLLGHLFGTDNVDEESAFTLLSALIGWSGEWGRDLGRRLQNNAAVLPQIRQAAEKCLVEIGELHPEQMIHLADEPESTGSGLEVIQVDYSSDMETLFESAWGFISQGRSGDALALWEESLYEHRKLYPPALFNMVDLYIEMRRYEEAGAILDLLEQVSQAEQGIFNQEIFFKRALLAYYEGSPALAWRYLDRMDIDILSETEHAGLLEFRELLRDAGIDSREGVSGRSDSSSDLASFRESKRRQVEDKDLPLQPSVRRGLKNMPAEWVNAVCLNLGIIGQGRRQEREQQIIDWLQNRQLLARLVHTLDDEQRSLLNFILGKNGWVEVAEIRPQFGALEGESYDWLNDGTSTVLGTLWSLGLLMIGRAGIDDRKVKIAAIPGEIREPLRSLL